MKYRLPAALGLVASIVLALVWGAAPASAHTPTVKATCESLTVDLRSYNGSKANSVTVWVDGQVVDDIADFDKTYTNTFTFADKFAAHTWRVKVVAHDDEDGKKGWSFDKSGTTAPCERPEVPNNPDVTVDQVCGSITFTFSNDVSLGANEVAPDASWVLAGETITVAPNAPHVSRTMTFTEDAADTSVTLDDETYTVESDCTPNVVPNDPAALIEAACGTASVTLSNDVQTGEHEVIGGEPAVFEVIVDGELDEVVEILPNDPTVTIEYAFEEDSGAHTVQVNDGDVVEVETDCIATPTPEPTPEPTPVPTPLPTPRPEVGVLSQTTTVPSVAAPALASTGGNLTLLAAAGAATMLAGTTLLAATRRRATDQA